MNCLALAISGSGTAQGIPDPAQLSPLVTEAAATPLLTQLLTSLAVGLLLAFGLQFLLTNLGIALGISIITLSAGTEADAANSETENASPTTPTGWLGLGILLAINSVLFAACFLAVRFSQVGDPVDGAIAGLTIWSAYLLILIWLSTKTLNSVAGLIFDWTTGGVRRLVSLVARALEPAPVEPLSEAQILESVQQEVRSVLDSAELRRLIAAELQSLTPITSSTAAVADHPTLSASADSQIWEPVITHLAETSPKSLTPKRLHRRLHKLFQSASTDLPADVVMPPLPMTRLATQVNQRQDLSDKKKQRILAQLEATWTDFAAALPQDLQPLAAPATSAQADLSPTTPSLDAGAISQELLQAAAGAALKQVLAHLPKLLQTTQLGLPSGLGLVAVALAKEQPELQPESLLKTLPLEATEVKQYVEQLLDETQGQIVHLGQASLEQADRLKELVLQPVERVQQGVQTRIEALKQQAYEQAEATRRAAATAAWWLLATATTGAMSAALAGAIGAGVLSREIFGAL